MLRAKVTFFCTAVSDASDSIGDVVSAAEADAASIAESTTPLLDTTGDLAATQAAVSYELHSICRIESN